MENEKYVKGALKRNTVLHARYRIMDILGQGGFGIVYLAYDLRQAENIAVKEYFPYGRAFRTGSSKVIFQENCMNGYKQFVREASVMEEINGYVETPAVWGFIRENNTAYIVMEYIKGVTLQKWIEKYGNIDAQSCFGMLNPVMQSLDRMHGRGILHMDICPENILISDTGKVKIIDFGSAVDLKYGSPSISEPTYRNGFSPPEQYEKNKMPGAWSDLYALCATIFFCLTGTKPEDARKRLKTDQLGGTGKIPEAVKKGLALEEKERWQDIKELLEALK